MKKINLYVNDTKKEAKELAKKVSDELQRQGYEVVASNADIVIGFGGDGTLLRFLKENDYKVESQYIGVNCGTLGFMQDFNVDDVEKFVTQIPKYIIQSIKLIDLTVIVNKKDISFKALNEFSVQERHDRSFRTSVSIDDEFFENFVGTGMIFSSPIGSTAHNLSAGGAILYPNINAIQITPREAISNSKIHTLSKSICIPEGLDITLESNNNSEIKIFSDGELVYKGYYDKLRISYSPDSIFKLKDKKDTFIKTIREKLI